MNTNVDRRSFMKSYLAGLGALSLGTSFAGMASAKPFLNYRSLKNLGPLKDADALGLRLPEGYAARLLAHGNQKVILASGAESLYTWHKAPDGGACYATEDGGWIYVSNSEIFLRGGAGALRFSAKGELIDAYPILEKTNLNCAGGPTPWSTWLSCEEIDRGRVFECDIYGQLAAVACPALGNFKHEAVALDVSENRVYLTEDEKDGCFYRYTAVSTGRMDFNSGLLEVATVGLDGRVIWTQVPNPNPGFFEIRTRKQVPGCTPFIGGEGIWYHEGRVIFTTKGDNRVWAYTTSTQALDVIYDQQFATNPILSGGDNLVVSSDGHILVAEDGSDMQIVVLGPFGDVYPLLQVMNQPGSELAGPAISPAGNRLYFSSQRGNLFGLTYEITGAFG